MTVYAIKHLPSGGYLPQRERRGHTFEEPRVGCVPRLFATPGAAKRALRAWLRGEWRVKRGRENDTPDGAGEWFEDLTVEEPRAERVAADMVVSRMSLRYLGK